MTKTQQFCISVADLHGNKVQYRKLLEYVVKQNIKYVFLAGDLLPKDGGSWSPDNKIRTIKMQADFINDFFLDYLKELGKYAKAYAIFGNDDFISNYILVDAANIPNVTFLNNETVPLSDNNGLSVAGYPHVGMTPFLHKDWEKWDETPNMMPHKIYRSEGYTSSGGIHIPANKNDDRTTIATDLELLVSKSDPRKTIYIFHEAPYNTPLDQISVNNKYIKDDQVHIGSHAIRKFIEQKQPLLTMHGHIHETFAESGDYIWRKGDSVSVTAANDFTSDKLSLVRFSLPNITHIERIII